MSAYKFHFTYWDRWSFLPTVSSLKLWQRTTADDQERATTTHTQALSTVAEHTCHIITLTASLQRSRHSVTQQRCYSFSAVLRVNEKKDSNCLLHWYINLMFDRCTKCEVSFIALRAYSLVYGFHILTNSQRVSIPVQYPTRSSLLLSWPHQAWTACSTDLFLGPTHTQL